MQVGVGYSDNPVTIMAGIQAAMEAIKNAARSRPCDLALMFSTSSHNAHTLREAVASVIGRSAPIVGGGATGAIANHKFGYSGDQIIVALFWLDEVTFQLEVEGGLRENEEATGWELGSKLRDKVRDFRKPVLLFYDAINREADKVSMIMATPLLKGFEDGLGFMPNLIGAGLQGDYVASPTWQWTGGGVAQHHSLALTFGGSIQMDSVIMHGCRPATGYYTVTKADRQIILEINGQPALDFMSQLLGHLIPPESFPFFLILGINKGERWGEFNEENYASRLCLALDLERRGIVMFEPDMVAGTEFQVMFRSLDLDYIPPRIESLFSGLRNCQPTFALYINCAGRAAAYSGADQEDAITVQNAVAGRVPLLGIYSGVEIAAVRGRPRGLDWTGVFALFSVPR
ncbi:MAG: FIST C-terminal domain-containing protein [Deltaproteobacteria bacterium]|nr:FIST C-terminal domain-containing protein [Deltaproteobacteria bacterium]